MDRDLRKRENRSKNREHRGGHGGFRGKSRGRGGPTNLPGNEQFLEAPESNDELFAVRRATIEAFSRQLPTISTFPESEFDGGALGEILSELSLEEQLSLEFLVELPRLQQQIESAVRVREGPQSVVVEQSQKPVEDNLDAWLDGLLS